MVGSFSEIPTDLRLPFVYTEFDPSQADRGLTSAPFNVLLVGQMLPTGGAAPLVPMRPTNETQGERYFGKGSQLAQMVAAYLKANRFTKMTAIGVLDADEGVAATGKITFTGAVTVSAPLSLYIGGVLVRVAAPLGQTADQAAIATAGAINANLGLSVIAAAGTEETSHVVTLTAKHKGATGNDIDLRVSYLEEDIPEGLTWTITKMSGGSTNPLPGPVIAAMSGERYHVIAWPWQDTGSLNAIRDELNDRWGPLRQNDGQAITVKTGTFAEVMTFTGGRNDKHLTVLPSEGSPTLPWVDCAASTAIIGYYGANDPARPFQTLTVPGVLAPPIQDRWADFPEKNQALFEGCSVRGVNASSEVMFLNVITTYRTSAFGAETQAYLQLNSLLTLSYLRYDWNNTIKVKYPRHKLASDADAKRVDPGQPIMTPAIMRAEAIAKVDEWVRQGLVEAPEDFASRLTVDRDSNNPNRLNVYMAPDLVNQFRVCATLISYLL
jgi:phage tail sheath gpL-like